MSRAAITQSTAWSPRGPVDGGVFASGAAEASIDLKGGLVPAVGGFVTIKLPSDAPEGILVGLRDDAAATLSTTPVTDLTAGGGVAVINPGEALEFAAEAANPFLIHKSVGGAAVTFYVWVS